uniref:(northern house mosquito) hypothetical protein n=1 Tax=Culex pipiens TaxID=7175 RepID=A0A8D8B8R4_CULPI
MPILHAAVFFLYNRKQISKIFHPKSFVILRNNIIGTCYKLCGSKGSSECWCVGSKFRTIFGQAVAEALARLRTRHGHEYRKQIPATSLRVGADPIPAPDAIRFPMAKKM